MAEPTFAIYSDSKLPGWAEGFAGLLREGPAAQINIAGSLDDAFDGDSDVLVLDLDFRRDEKLSAERIASLGQRRIIAMAPGADWLCGQLDEIEFNGSNVTGDLPMLVVDSGLLGKRWADEPMRPFSKVQDAPLAEWTLQTPRVYFCAGNVAEYRPGVDYILVAEKLETCAVVVRQANFVFAGVQAHPDDYSEEYRSLIRRVAFALADRPIETLVPIVVDRQVHPPGSIRFDLSPASSGENRHRVFYFRFDRPTAFTATLEHTGSDAMMLLFAGDKKGLYWTRQDTEAGKTLTVAANISDASIQALGHRYWMLNVTNFDGDNGASATLTVRYDGAESQAPIRPLPGNAGFEHLNRDAQNLFEAARLGDATAVERVARFDSAVRPAQMERNLARQVTAREHGFDRWDILDGHLAWELPGSLPSVMAYGAGDFYDRGVARYRESFSIAELVELTGDFTEDAVAMLTSSFAHASARGHRSFTGEHLLSALLDNPVSIHALHSVGCDVDPLRQELRSFLRTVPSEALDGDVQASRALCGAVYRANFIPTLGREGTNPANLLVGLAAEGGEAAKALARRGVSRGDLVNYVTHGIATELAGDSEPNASVLGAELERAVHLAFLSARSSHHEHLTIEHLLLAVLGVDLVTDTLQFLGVDAGELGRDLTNFVEQATPVATVEGQAPRPTRAFNRIMQMVVAKARSSERFQASTLDALWALCGEREVPVADFLERYGVRRADVAARIG